jgi:hypothetical protein
MMASRAPSALWPSFDEFCPHSGHFSSSVAIDGPRLLAWMTRGDTSMGAGRYKLLGDGGRTDP